MSINENTPSSGRDTAGPKKKPGRFMLAMLRRANDRLNRSPVGSWHDGLLSGEATLPDLSRQFGLTPVIIAVNWSIWATLKRDYWVRSAGEVGTSPYELDVVARVIAYGLLTVSDPFSPVPQESNPDHQADAVPDWDVSGEEMVDQETDSADRQGFSFLSDADTVILERGWLGEPQNASHRNDSEDGD